uniref:F-box domain-containing protein n=1 Tax=Tetranychus urticae TaxID=32264 RepID=T1L2T2_TETUR
MLINEIPDDCLLAIFDYLNNLDDLINCYKVCVKWSYLIAKRTKKVKYLLGKIQKFIFQIILTIHLMLFITCIKYHVRLNQPIAGLSPELNTKVEDVIEFVRSQKTLKGLINDFDVPIEKYCDRLEMLSVEYFNPNNLQNSSSMKQLVIRNYSLEALKRDVHYLPNLERLKIQIKVPDNPYDGPVLEKLKILEYYYQYPRNFFYGFKLMDSCPNLQSAHFLMNDTWVFDETLKHKCLQDLVIQYYGWYDENDNWNNLKRLLMKYPNLKHLALRDTRNIIDENIEELVLILPNLVLLDVSGCKGVTQRAADYVKDYCKRNGRLIKFYFNGNREKIQSDWPQLSSEYEVSRGFDFMKHCFFRDHFFLSNFLIPIDY